MKKKLLPLAIAAAMAPGFAAAAADTSGFANITYNIADDASTYGTDGKSGGGDDTLSATEGKFSANGELDFSASPADGVTVRLDVDLMLDTAGAGNSANLEQAFFAWGATEDVTVIGGVFNNPIGMESQNDRPDMWGNNRGVIGNILDQQTALYDNNVAGLAVAGAVGPATVTVAYLNDLDQIAEENSIALVVNASPIAGLDLELGFVSQADKNKNSGSAEDVVDFNVSYAIPGVAGLTVALDYLSTGNIIDSAYEIKVDYNYGPWGVGVRAENVSWAAAGAADSERNTFHGSYQVASNLKAVLEFADGDNANPAGAVTGIRADSLTTLDLVATF